MPERRPNSGESAAAFQRLSGLVADRDLKRLFDYWRSKRNGRPMPSKADIDPLDIGWALSRIYLTDYRPSEGFVYRLAGAEIAKMVGRSNLKGMNLRQVVNPERLSLVEASWLRVVEERAVVRMAGMIYYGVDRTPVGERLLLPLADTVDGPVTGLLGMTVYKWVAGKLSDDLKTPHIDALPVSEIP